MTKSSRFPTNPRSSKDVAPPQDPVRRRVRHSLSVGGILLAILVLSTCKNPLVTDIEAAVKVVVTPPGIESIYPAQDATNVPVNVENLSVTFSKPIDQSSVKTSTITMTDPSGQVIGGVFSVSTATVTFNPNPTLSYSTTYTITITREVRDTDGNGLSETYTWSFTTGAAPDTTPPHATSITVAGDAEWSNTTSVTLQLQAQDDSGAVAQMNVSNSNSFPDAGWTTYQETLEWELENGEGPKTVYVKYRDGAGNLTDAVSDAIGLDTTVPTITSLTLNDGKPGTNTTSVPVVVVAADADDSSGVSTYRIRFEGEDWQDWTDLDSGIGNLTVELPVALGETATIEAQVRDVAGNESAVETRDLLYEQDPPTVTSVSPAENESGVPANATVVRVVFNEAIDEESLYTDSGDVKLVISDATGQPVAGTLASTDGGTVIELTDLDLAQNSDYTVSLPSTVTDTAGNTLGTPKTWYFRTGDALDETEPEVRAFQLAGGVNATQDTVITIDLDVVDDYNVVYGMKLWGDSDGSRPQFEDEPTAAWESYAPTVSWNLPAGDGDNYIFARFMDSAQNTTATPVRLKVILDNTNPTVSSLAIDDGNPDYTNNADRLVTLYVGADDSGGSGIKEMKISHDSDFTDDPWESWSPVRQNWQLTESDGEKTVYVKVRDFVDLESTQFSDTITLDLTPPTVDLGPEDALNVNTETQTVSGFAADATSGVASYEWQQMSGPDGGIVTFDDATLESPAVSADIEGTYQLKVAVTDQAGNSSFGTLEFVWDITPPASPPQVTVDEYSGTTQPTWSWSAVDGADYYEATLSHEPGTTYTVESTQFQPTFELPEGNHTLDVVAYDRAGNFTAPGTATTLVDVTPPIIGNDGSVIIANGPVVIPYGPAVDEEGDVGTGASGVASYIWAHVSGPVTVSFSNPTAANPEIGFGNLTNPGEKNGEYEVTLAVTDSAGNTSTTTFYLELDTVPPATPILQELERTPSLRPRWNWESGGGGNGTYRVLIDGTEVLTDAVTTYRPGSAFVDGVTYQFAVQERDDAGNWSTVASESTLIDTDYTTPPDVWLDGHGSTANVDTINWRWSSGLGEEDESDYYRYRINGGSWVETDQNQLDLAAPSVGTYLLEIEERNVDVWTGEVAANTVTIDRTAPSGPTVGALDGEATTGNPQPTWSWTSGGSVDSAGVYRYRIDGAAWTQTNQTQATASAELEEPGSQGDHTMEVQERDVAGNWSASGSFTITIDRIAPTLTSINVWDPDSESPEVYAADSTISYSIVATAEPDMQMQFYDYENDTWPDSWVSFIDEAHDYELHWPDTDEFKYVVVRVRDRYGNVSPYVFDSLTLDTTPPIINSFLIESTYDDGQEHTRSYRVSIASSVTGATSMELVNGNASFTGAWTTFNAARSWNLTGGYGAKQVRARFKDAAGNVSAAVDDRIFYGIANPTTITRGKTSNGDITVKWTPYGSEFGSAPQIDIYASTSSTDNGVLKGSVPATDGTFTFTGTKGTLYYVRLRLRDDAVGEHPDYSVPTAGFSSDMVIIYDQDDSNDVTIAGDMHSTLTTRWFDSYGELSHYYEGSTIPTYTVTLFPDDLVPSYYDERVDYDTRIWGDPVIVLPGVDAMGSSSRAHNVAFSSGNGVIAMGGASSDGAHDLFSRISTYHASWGVDDTSFLVTHGAFTEVNNREYIWKYGNFSWYYPIKSTILGGSSPSHNSSTQISYQTLKSYSIYIPGGTPPTNAIIHGRANYHPLSVVDYYNVVQMGKFLLFGFDKFPDRPYTGRVYFYNLVWRMRNYH